MSAPMPLMQACAERGFFDLSFHELTSVARNIGLAPQDIANVTTLQLLEKMCWAVLPWCTDSKVSHALQSRLRDMDFQSSVGAEGLLEIDDAWDMMDRDDEKELRREQKDLKGAKAEYEGFVQSFAKRQRDLREKAVTTLEKKRGKPFAKAAPKRLPMPNSVVSQKDASGLLPPGASIWRIASNNGWAVHCPPMRRYSVSALKARGECEAMLNCLRVVWRTYLTMQGLPADHCPIDGLLTTAEASPAAATESASSSTGRVGSSSAPAARSQPADPEASPRPAKRARKN